MGYTKRLMMLDEQQGFYDDTNYIIDLEAVVSPFINLESELADLKQLIMSLQNTAIVSANKRKILHLVYANLITVWEVYLQDTFIYQASMSDSYLEKYLTSYVKKNQTPGTQEEIATLAINHMLTQVWHRHDFVLRLYKTVLLVDLPKSELIKEAIKTRHDIVHRNGKTKDGYDAHISEEDINALSNEVRTLAKQVESQIVVSELHEI